MNNSLINDLSQSTYQPSVDNVINYIQDMDIVKLDEILDNQTEYQNQPKGKFIKSLNSVFETFKSNNNDKLIKHSGACISDKCANSCKNGYSFTGNQSKHMLNLIFEVESGIVQNLHDCFDFKILDKDFNSDDYIQLTILNLDGDSVNGITSFF